MSIYRMSKDDAIHVISSSRGSQIKFYKDNYWYKIDESGPEGTAEYLTTIVLKHSNLAPSKYVSYELCDIDYGGKIQKGCRSKNFLHDKGIFISYDRIYNSMTGRNLSEDIIPLSDPKERIDFVCDVVKDFTDLDSHEQISRILTLDMLTLNTDRHFHNIGVIMDTQTGEFRHAPIFDNGAAFLCNYTRNPPSLPIDDIDVHSNIFGRPFSPDLEYQAVCAGLSMRFDFKGIQDELLSHPELIESRPAKILMHQIELYQNEPDLVLNE